LVDYQLKHYDFIQKYNPLDDNSNISKGNKNTQEKLPIWYS